MITQVGHKLGCEHVFVPGEAPSYDAGQTVFVRADYVTEFFSLDFKKPLVVVSGMSDYSPSTFFTDEEISNILANPMIIEWRAQNVCTTHPKLKHLPIGLEDTQTKLDFCRDFGDELKSIPKSDKVYYNFTNSTNPYERSCFDTHPTSPKCDFETYMREMARHKYVLCPMGNGIDSHRFWEAQVCGCIPIVRCPKEFLPTYEGVPYVCLPGWCFARLGDARLVRKMASVFKLGHGGSMLA